MKQNRSVLSGSLFNYPKLCTVIGWAPVVNMHILEIPASKLAVYIC